MQTISDYYTDEEDIRFTDEEWIAMEDSPRYYGLVLECGHGLAYRSEAEGCLACLAIAEMGDSDEAIESLEAFYQRAPADKEIA